MKVGDRVKIKIVDRDAYTSHVLKHLDGQIGALERLVERSFNNMQNGAAGPAWLVRLDNPVPPPARHSSQMKYFWVSVHELHSIEAE